MESLRVLNLDLSKIQRDQNNRATDADMVKVAQSLLGCCEFLFSMWKSEIPMTEDHYTSILLYLMGVRLLADDKSDSLQVLEKLVKVVFEEEEWNEVLFRNRDPFRQGAFLKEFFNGN